MDTKGYTGGIALLQGFGWVIEMLLICLALYFWAGSTVWLGDAAQAQDLWGLWGSKLLIYIASAAALIALRLFMEYKNFAYSTAKKDASVGKALALAALFTVLLAAGVYLFYGAMCDHYAALDAAAAEAYLASARKIATPTLILGVISLLTCNSALKTILRARLGKKSAAQPETNTETQV